ncbi:MAG: hypothetical protein WBB19_05180 [Desulforhopalus sp.]
MRALLLTLACLCITSSLVSAGEADVLEVRIEKTDDGYLNVYATVQHDDEGMEHYADRWEILDMEGNLLDERILRHPHSAAPFTRSILRARLPKGTGKIRVRAHDNVHGYGGKVMETVVPEI